MTLKELRVTELMTTHDLPAEIIGQCVDDLGIIDDELLGIALQTKKFAAEGLASKDKAEIEKLKGLLQTAQEEMKTPGIDKMYAAQRVMAIKDRIFRLGGRM
jgi:hypothetical protein